MDTIEITIDQVRIRIALANDRAPATCRYFVNAIRRGHLDTPVVFRVLGATNQQDRTECLINAVQFGTPDGLDAPRTVISHEDTVRSGLRHKKWTVSAARYGPGELYRSFFVCMRDERELDFGGCRQPDGMGFAAFGNVIDGFEPLLQLHASAGDSQLLIKPKVVESLTLSGPNSGAET